MARRRSSHWKLKYAAAAAVLIAAAVLLFMHRGRVIEFIQGAGAPPVKEKQVGYKPEDRRKLEQLINTDAKND